MNTNLIKLFNAAIPEETLNFATINEIAMKVGYLVEPAACTISVFNFLKKQQINRNSTFYKNWQDVTSKSRIELLLDQLHHYMTTYGTGFSVGNGYVPNDGEDNLQTIYSSYKVIKAISKEELYDKCFGLLTSGIALKQDTMHAVADYVIDYAGKSIDVDSIMNREAIIYICDKAGLCPNDKFSLLRYIVYKTTGSEMIIKNKEMINKITQSTSPFKFARLNAKQMEALASIFLRYKDIFLAFKHTSNKKNASYINKLRKMAVKLHEPMKAGFWQTVFTKEYTADEIEAHIGELTAYKMVALMQNCMQRASMKENQLYLVRNQKMYIREGYTPKNNKEYLMMVYSILRHYLVETLKKNSMKQVTKIDGSTQEAITVDTPKVVKVLDGVTIALPTSEKSFIGNYPFGTTYMLSENNYFGIYWRNEWGTRDFDISFCDIEGNKIGWNSDYYDDGQNVIFSGDMTNAEPEAAEVIYMKKAGAKGIVSVNQFSGEPNSKFDFFFGQSDKGIVGQYYREGGYVGHMVDPDSVKLEFDVPVENQKQQSVAVVDSDRVVLMAVNTGNRRVSRSGNYVNTVTDAIMAKAHNFVNAVELLKEAGYTIVDESYDDNVDIDFTNLDKDSLIALMK